MSKEIKEKQKVQNPQQEQRYIKIPVPSFVTNKYVPLLVVGILSTILLSVLLFGKFQTSSAQNTSLIGIFITGLIAGGLTCMAVQGGLLAATIAQREEERLKEKTTTGTALPILSFLGAKLIAYTILGLLLGLLGSAFQLSLTARTILQFAVVIFMVGTALNILQVHPIFRYFVIQPPRFLTRLVRKQSKSNDVLAPAMLGAFTIFIPCGTTQAIMALAIASGNPFYGAAMLFAFVLGTSPLFFLLGYFATKLGGVLQQRFMKIAAYAIILLALFNFNNALTLSGSPVTVVSILAPIWCGITYCSLNTTSTTAQTPVQDANIAITSSGYTPTALTVKAGSNVTLHLHNTDGNGCQQGFTIPQLGLQKVVPVGASDTLAFTAPSQPGQLRFVCSMGMYSGTITVI